MKSTKVTRLSIFASPTWCKSSEVYRFWNVTGPKGATGATGATGTKGNTGNTAPPALPARPVHRPQGQHG